MVLAPLQFSQCLIVSPKLTQYTCFRPYSQPNFCFYCLYNMLFGLLPSICPQFIGHEKYINYNEIITITRMRCVHRAPLPSTSCKQQWSETAHAIGSIAAQVSCPKLRLVFPNYKMANENTERRAIEQRILYLDQFAIWTSLKIRRTCVFVDLLIHKRIGYISQSWP